MISKTEMIHLPIHTVSQRQLCDLELLLNGAFAPVNGFMTEAEYSSVVHDTRLPSGEIWPIPIVLDVPEHSEFAKGDKIVLADAYGTQLAVLTVTSRYSPDRITEVQKVYGTDDPDHWGVGCILTSTHPVYIGGTVEKIADPGHALFSDLYKTPKQIKEWKQSNNITALAGFQTRNPLHRAHFEVIKRAAKEYDAHVLIHPSVGETKSGDTDAHTRVRVYRHIHEKYASKFTYLSLLPLAMRMAGPREALWHALIRKNYGCTHFIVGRDHAGPGKNKAGESYYGLYDAQHYVQQFADELDINIIPMPEMVYDSVQDMYIATHEQSPTTKPLAISGTEFRNLLREQKPIPEWFSFPEVIAELQKNELANQQKGFVLFFTGLSGAGKSTIAQAVQNRLLEIQPRAITYLDGDIVRKNISKGLGFSKEDRNTNIKRIGFVATEVVKHGGIVICAAIAPYAQSREYNRRVISEYGRYVEIYVSTPLAVCKMRDVKGLYARAEAGLIHGVTGVDDPYEIPQNPEISIDTNDISVTEAVDMIMTYLNATDLLL